LFPVCIASLLFSYSANSRKCVIKLSVSVSVINRRVIGTLLWAPYWTRTLKSLSFRYI